MTPNLLGESSIDRVQKRAHDGAIFSSDSYSAR